MKKVPVVVGITRPIFKYIIERLGDSEASKYEKL